MAVHHLQPQSVEHQKHSARVILNVASRVHGHRSAVMETFLRAPRIG
jgi:hypothetical protein